MSSWLPARLALAPRTLLGAAVDNTGGGNAPVGLDARLGLLKALPLPETTRPAASPANEGETAKGIESRVAWRPQ